LGSPDAATGACDADPKGSKEPKSLAFPVALWPFQLIAKKFAKNKKRAAKEER
jgi:hypothetical protein